MARLLTHANGCGECRVLSMKAVRRIVESDLGLAKKQLDEQKDVVTALVDQVCTAAAVAGISLVVGYCLASACYAAAARQRDTVPANIASSSTSGTPRVSHKPVSHLTYLVVLIGPSNCRCSAAGALTGAVGSVSATSLACNTVDIHCSPSNGVNNAISPRVALQIVFQKSEAAEAQQEAAKPAKKAADAAAPKAKASKTGSGQKRAKEQQDDDADEDDFDAPRRKQQAKKAGQPASKVSC
jgi:hypothetical protein